MSGRSGRRSSSRNHHGIPLRAPSYRSYMRYSRSPGPNARGAGPISGVQKRVVVGALAAAGVASSTTTIACTAGRSTCCTSAIAGAARGVDGAAAHRLEVVVGEGLDLQVLRILGFGHFD